jgi:hypothetical protein
MTCQIQFFGKMAFTTGMLFNICFLPRGTEELVRRRWGATEWLPGQTVALVQLFWLPWWESKSRILIQILRNDELWQWDLNGSLCLLAQVPIRWNLTTIFQKQSILTVRSLLASLCRFSFQTAFSRWLLEEYWAWQLISFIPTRIVTQCIAWKVLYNWYTATLLVI